MSQYTIRLLLQYYTNKAYRSTGAKRVECNARIEDLKKKLHRGEKS